MRQEERKERSRNLIIKAAMEEFASSGYGAASIEIICNRHGISKGMMYHYFHGKDELFRIREPLKELNWSFVRSAVRQLPLRDGISEDMATRYINSIIPTFRTILTSYSSQDDLHGILDSTGHLLDMLLFGIGRA